jgi:hypothetical protein
MTRSTRLLAACGLLAATALPFPLMAQKAAQNAAPTDATGRTAPPGTAATPPKSATNDGGQRPPTDATGRTAPAGTPAAPSRLATPGTATPSPPATAPK